MATAPNTLTPEEYLRLERASEEKHEYADGQMFAMAGASLNHRDITTNIHFALRAKQAAFGCKSDSFETRLFIPATKRYTYADVVMTCEEERKFQDDVLDTLLNPTLIVEVLSPSTEAYDRGKKFIYYKSIPSFTEYLLVSQDEVLVEQRSLLQPEDFWRQRFYDSLADSVTLGCGMKLPLSTIYAGVALGQPSTELVPFTAKKAKKKRQIT